MDYVFRFDVDSKGFFTQSDRILIMNYILQLETFEDEESNQSECVGLQKLLNEDVYTTAYPVHDDTSNELLLQEWASLSKCYKSQPLDAIKDYFGVKIALYFAWLGFYTNMLIPVSIFGIFCLLYGYFTLPKDSLSRDMCDSSLNLLMCPQCDRECDYWEHTDACLYTVITHTFDNVVTLFFAIVMSVWSSLYLNLWNRYSSEIVHRWGLSTLQPEAVYPRPEYLAKMKSLNIVKMKKNKVTNKEEPAVPWKLKYPIRVFSVACALFWVSDEL